MEQLLRCPFSIIIPLIFFSQSLTAQESIPQIGALFSRSFFNGTESKLNKITGQVNQSTTKYAKKLVASEKKLLQKLSSSDSVLARAFYNQQPSLDSLVILAATNPYDMFYVHRLDSLRTVIQFALKQSGGINSQLKKQLTSRMQQVDVVQKQISGLDNVDKLLAKRQSAILEKLSGVAPLKELERYRKQIYYFREKIQHYKTIVNSPTKVESEVLRQVSRLPAFRQFFNKYSQLATLFQMPDGSAAATMIPDGLQTRALLEQTLIERFGRGPNVNQFIGGQVNEAQSALQEVKGKLTRLGQSGSHADNPDFLPNNQKNRTMFQRLVVGTTFQSSTSNYFVPTSTNMGLSFGYKINDRSITGVGFSHKLGWGRSIRHIMLTHQGLSLRSFLDVKLKKSFWISGGFEMNHLTGFDHIDQLKKSKDWQTSGLIGLSKKISLKNKLLKSTKIQLLWDFLSYQQIPRPQPVIYRLSYDF